MQLLTKDDRSPVVIRRADSDHPLLFVCDHAGRAVPERLGDLGLAASEFERHIAWDIGAGALSFRLGDLLGACVVQQSYSRLVIDCNRRPGAVDSIPDFVDRTPIARNRAITGEEAAARVEEIHTPYHRAIAEILDARAARGVRTYLILIHSFTPSLGGKARPWRFGVLHAHDSELSNTMLRRLAQEPNAVVGDNEPYAMDQIDYTAPHHARPRKLDYCELEIRQDLIGDQEGCEQVAQLLSRLLAESIA